MAAPGEQIRQGKSNNEATVGKFDFSTHGHPLYNGSAAATNRRNAESFADGTDDESF
jgi:hypothetical protein